MKYLLSILVVFVSFTSCEQEFGDDPNLYGSWSNGLTIYTFNSDDTYSVEYLFTGDSLNPVVADSLFGTYLVDTKRSNITFSIDGYKVDSSDVIVYEKLNASTWNYNIKNNNTLIYSSNTTQGEMARK